MAKSDLDKKLELRNSVLEMINKKYGAGTALIAGEDTGLTVETFSSGSYLVDSILGGGIPKGRIVEIYGPQASGKSTLTMSAIAEVQKSGGQCAFIDAEHAFSIKYAKDIGIDTDALTFIQPNSGEQAMDIVETLVRSGAYDLIVVDSVSNLVPEAELNGEITDQHMGLLARLLSKGLRKITGPANETKTTVCFINQIRDKIGGMGYGPQTETTGGHALKFYSSQRIEIKRTGSIKQGEEVIGNTVKVKAAKNKVASPFGECSTEIYFGKGFSKIGELIDLALKKKIIAKAGSWFSYGDGKLGQGKPKVMDYLEENPEILKEIEEKVFAEEES